MTDSYTFGLNRKQFLRAEEKERVVVKFLKMPKDRRANSSSFDRSMVSPYSCSSRFSDRKKSKASSPHVGDEKEWEKVRCPICMEPPHNAILLLCSSRDKGCRPFICDNSYRHSNCFDQFRKSSAAANSHAPVEEQEQQSKLVCPFCRGAVTGWDVVDPARKFMNSKTRNCSSETCGFNGNYAELRKHARVEHPSHRPSETNPSRQTNWAMLEQQMEIEDALLYQSDIDLWPSFDELVVDDDFWSEGSFFDFPSGMSDVEDEVLEEMLGNLPFSCFSLFPLSSEDEMMDSGNSRSGDQPGWATPSGLEDANGPRPIPVHQSELRSWHVSSRSDYYRENNGAISSSRGDDGASSRTRRSGFENIPRPIPVEQSDQRSLHVRSRSEYESRELVDHESSRTRSSDRREDEQRNSRSGSGSRSYPAYGSRRDSSRQRRSDTTNRRGE